MRKRRARARTPFLPSVSHGNAEFDVERKGGKVRNIANLSTLVAAAAGQVHASQNPEQNQAFFHSIHSDQISFRTKLKSKSSADQKNIILN